MDHFRYLGIYGKVNIKITLEERGCEDVVWIQLAQDRSSGSL
jgi:hypothetical protein